MNLLFSLLPQQQPQATACVVAPVANFSTSSNMAEVTKARYKSACEPLPGTDGSVFVLLQQQQQPQATAFVAAPAASALRSGNAPDTSRC